MTTFFLACSLCCVALKPNTQCDHVQYVDRQWTEETIVSKKSILGNKTDKMVTCHHSDQMMKCRCGFTENRPTKRNCGIDQKYGQCSCKKTIYGDCANISSQHKCIFGKVANIIAWQREFETKDILQPSGQQHRHQCTVCKTIGKIRVTTYKPCDICLGTGGIKCGTCCNMGATPNRCSDWAFSGCPDKCNNGYIERCYVCEGGQAIKSGQKVIDCTKCEVRSAVPNVLPIYIPQVSLPLSLPLSLPPILRESPMSPRPPSPSIQKRPPSPSQVGLPPLGSDQIQIGLKQ